MDEAQRRNLPSLHVSPEQIIHAIALTGATIKIISGAFGTGAETLHPVDAAALVRRYPHDQWTVKLRANGDVKWIRREVNTTPSLYRAPWSKCYRTAEAPVLQPSVEWLNNRLGGGVA